MIYKNNNNNNNNNNNVTFANKKFYYIEFFPIYLIIFINAFSEIYTKIPCNSRFFISEY